MNLIRGLFAIVLILLFVFTDRDEQIAHED